MSIFSFCARILMENRFRQAESTSFHVCFLQTRKHCDASTEVSRTERRKKSLLSATHPCLHKFQTKTRKQKLLPTANPSWACDICAQDGGLLQKQNPRRSSSERREIGGSQGERLGALLPPLLGALQEVASKSNPLSARRRRAV